MPDTLVITGVMAAGKSTVAQLLAERYERSVHVRGDVFRRMIVSGRDPITSGLGPEAERQLELRRRLAAAIADEYWRSGFDVLLQDIYPGRALTDLLDRIHARPLYLVVLAPRPEAVSAREEQRQKTGYRDWDVRQLCESFERETPRLGLWIDTSDQSPDETVEEILARKQEARIR